MHFFQHARVVGSVASLAAGMAIASCKKAEPTTSTPPPTAKDAAPAAAAKSSAAPAPETVRKVHGRWMRTDGGKFIELRDAEKSGVIHASYFNPNPIRVSRAIWMQGAEGLQIVVELNDQGYPGATYVLTYDPRTDRLVGQYNQPAMQQSFDIDFVRQKGP